MLADQNKIAPFLALIIGLIVMPIALLGWDLSFLPGDLGDTRFNIYILEHGYRFLIGKNEWYWNAPFMYPAHDVISFSDNLLGVVPFYSAFRVVGFDIFTSFQLWVITIFALNFAAAYWFLKSIFKNTYAAAMGAFIFAFSISLQSQMGHAQVFARFFIPLVFLFIFKFAKTFRPGYFFLSVLCLVGQFYNGIYLGMLTVLPFVLVVLILAVRRRTLLLENIKKLKWVVLMAVSTLLNALLLFNLMLPYYKRSLTTHPTSYEEVFVTIPKIVSYFFAKNGSLLWKSLETHATDIPAWYDHQIFPGAFVYLSIIAALMLIISLKKSVKKEVSLMLITGLITLFIFMRFGNFSLYEYIYNIPGIHSLRSLTRIIGVELLFFGTAVGFVVKYLIEKFQKRQLLIFIIILGFVVIDNYVDPSKTYRSKKAIAGERVDNLKAKMDYLPAGTVISYEPENIDNAIYIHLDAMLASQALELKCINGYSATSPWAFHPYWVEPNAENRQYWLNMEGYDGQTPVVIK